MTTKHTFCHILIVKGVWQKRSVYELFRSLLLKPYTISLFLFLCVCAHVYAIQLDLFLILDSPLILFVHSYFIGGLLVLSKIYNDYLTEFF